MYIGIPIYRCGLQCDNVRSAYLVIAGTVCPGAGVCVRFLVYDKHVCSCDVIFYTDSSFNFLHKTSCI